MLTPTHLPSYHVLQKSHCIQKSLTLRSTLTSREGCE